MKIRTVITGLCLFATAMTARANYDINFDTFDPANDPSFTQHLAFDVDGITKLTGPVFEAQLYVGANAGSLASIGAPVQFQRAGAGDGYVNGGPLVNVPDSSLNAGSSAFYAVRAWRVSDGSSYEVALATPGAHVGSSQITAITLGGTVAGIPPQLIVATANLHPSFSLSVVPANVPEPSVLALGLLGGAALMFRRRK